MATIVITIPDAALPRARTALCAYINATETNANAKAGLAQMVKNWVQQYESDQARIAAEASVPTPPDVT